MTRPGLQLYVHDISGAFDRELAGVDVSTIEWSVQGGSCALTVPVGSAAWRSDPHFWESREFEDKLLYIEFENGLADWCGVLSTWTDKGDNLEVMATGALSVLDKLGPEIIWKQTGLAKEVLSKALALSRRDSYPVTLGEIDPGGHGFSGYQVPQPLSAVLQNVATTNDWKFVLTPSRNSLTGQISLTLSVGEDPGEDLSWSTVLRGCVNIVDWSLSGDTQSKYNRIVGIGGGDTTEKKAVYVYPAEPAADGSLTGFITYPDAPTFEDVRKKVRADYDKHMRSPKTAAATISSAGGREAYRSLALYNKVRIDLPGFEKPVTVLGWGYHADSETVGLVIRHADNIEDSLSV